MDSSPCVRAVARHSLQKSSMRTEFGLNDKDLNRGMSLGPRRRMALSVRCDHVIGRVSTAQLRPWSS